MTVAAQIKSLLYNLKIGDEVVTVQYPSETYAFANVTGLNHAHVTLDDGFRYSMRTGRRLKTSLDVAIITTSRGEAERRSAQLAVTRAERALALAIQRTVSYLPDQIICEVAQGILEAIEEIDGAWSTVAISGNYALLRGRLSDVVSKRVALAALGGRK